MGALSSYSNGESGSQDRGLKGAKEPPTGVGQRAGSGASGAGGRMFPPEGHDHQRVGEGLCEPGVSTVAAAAAKSLQSCPTLHDPIDGLPPSSTIPGILQALKSESMDF